MQSEHTGQQNSDNLEQVINDLQATRQSLEQAAQTVQSQTTSDTTQQSQIATVQFAGFWIRLVANVIDAIILGIVFWAIRTTAFSSGYYMYAYGWEQFAIVMVYFVLLQAKYGQTVGKRLMGLKVVDAHGKLVSIQRLIGRYISKFLSALPFGLGFLAIAWNKHKQGWHDQLAKTFVIKNK